MMSEINALWRRVRALQRKLARELAEYRLGFLCDAPNPNALLNAILPSLGK